jgi:type I restriction enzyme S subunit
MALEAIMPPRLGTIDPSEHPDEEFDLYSIPAYDAGEPEVAKGRQIGSAKQVVQPGDVLLSRIVPHIRRAWVVAANRGRRIIASGEWIVFRGSRALPQYLRHVLVGDPFHAEFMHTVSGVGGSLLRARPAHVAKIRIPVPPLPEQRRIAEILDKADALRAKRRAALTQLDTLTQSIFLEMFGDPIANPRSWPRKKLAAMGSLDRGVSRHRPRNARELLGGPYPFVQTGDVANCGGYIRDYSATYSDAGLRQSKMWPAGTLCITIAANIAKTGILTFDACFPDSVVGFRANEPGTVEFVRSWLSFLQASLEDKAPESAQKNINLEILRGLDVPAPDVPLRVEFARRIEAVESLKGKERDAQAGLHALFGTLQHLAFRGDL